MLADSQQERDLSLLSFEDTPPPPPELTGSSSVSQLSSDIIQLGKSAELHTGRDQSLPAGFSYFPLSNVRRVGLQLLLAQSAV